MKLADFIPYVQGIAPIQGGKEVDDEVRNLLLTDGADFIMQHDLWKMRKGLLDKQYYEGDAACVLPINVLKYVHGVIGGGKDKRYNPLGHQNWDRAIGLIKGRLDTGDRRFNSIFGTEEAKELNYVQALKRLKPLGLICEFTENGVAFKGTEQQIFRLVNSEIRRIGGIRFLNALFSTIEYDNDIHRFVLPRQGNMPKVTEISIDLPYNFMLNVGLRHLKHDGERGIKDKDIRRVIDICRDICFACYPVQEWSIWGDIFYVDKSPIEYIRNLVYKKSIYGLDQASPEYVKGFLRFTIDYIKSRPELFQFKLGFGLDDYLTVMDAVMALTSSEKIRIVDVGKIRTRLDRRTLSAILQWLCQPVSKVNDGYYSPMEYERVSYWPTPIFTDKTNMILMPTSISAWGWVEALLAAIRQVDSSVDKEMGTIIEKYVAHKFGQHGISSIGGEYQQPKTGECDHVVVTNDRVVFIEDKKKPLTRAAYSGVFKNILSDLTQSLVASQQQCLQHQEDLMKAGQLAMTDKETGVVTTLDNSILKFENISLSLPDYGPIQSRIILKQVLDLIIRNDFHADTANITDPEELKDIQARVADLAKKQKKLRSSVAFLAEQQNDGRFDPFFDSWFMSLEQLTFVIEHSDSNDKFYEILKKIKYTTVGTLDFYNEWRVFCR